MEIDVRAGGRDLAIHGDFDDFPVFTEILLAS
jgi:hypothetical protein